MRKVRIIIFWCVSLGGVDAKAETKTLIEPIPAENFRFPGRHSPKAFCWNDDCVWFGQPISIQQFNPEPLDWTPLFKYLKDTGWVETDSDLPLGGSENTRRFLRRPGVEGFRGEHAIIEPTLNIFVFAHNPVIIPYQDQLMENGAPRPHVIPELSLIHI